MEKGERLRQARMSAGFKSASEAARTMGVNPSTYISHENGTRDFDDTAADLYARRLKASTDWLLYERGEPPIVRTFDRGEPARAVEIERPKTDPAPLITAGGPNHHPGGALLPVYAATQGGQGHLIVTFDPVDYKSAPEEVMRAKDAHGILVVGDSMVPAYWPGDIVWVTPYKPLQRDKDYVLYHGKPAGEAECMIKRLVGFSDRTLKLRQWNPLKDFTEDGKDWPVRHQIHSKTNA